jgi:cytochrome c-type biogenesis protein
MALGPGGYGLGFLAGPLSVLSPCVLPLAPIVVGLRERRKRGQTGT